MAEPLINVGDWIAKWAAISPEKQAIISERGRIAFADLSARINRLARFLLSTGLRKGDRVAVLLRNCREYAEIFFAVSKVGGVLVPLNWRLAVPELEHILRDSGAEYIFFEDDFGESAEALRRKVPCRLSIACSLDQGAAIPQWALDYDDSVHSFPAEEPDIGWASGDDDPHILMYTSGTTGLPKGAMLSHKKTFFNTLNATNYFNLNTGDTVIISRPLFHSGGLIVEMAPVLYKGGTVIIRKRFRPREILETIEAEKVTILELPATVYNFILEDCALDRYDLSSVKCCFTGGERVPLSLLQAYADRGILISQIYGLTEASTIFWLPMKYARSKMGSVGRAVFHGEVKIVDDDGKPVGPGEVGEVVVKGPIVMNGYWRRPDLTAEVIREGWLHTGDLARVDTDGFFYIVDRKKDMFISGGENVYPAEVEKALLGHRSVLDAAVVGVPDERWGEVGKAFVVLKEGEGEDRADILHYLEGRLARYKIPKYIAFTDNLPKTASGKILKRLLARR